MGFWKREDELERELRANRPEPRRELVDEIARSIAGKRRRGASRRGRVGLAAALTAGMLGALGAFGGLSYAANGVTNAVSSAVHVFVPDKVSVPSGGYSSAMAQYKVAFCWHGHTISVDSHAAHAFLARGASEGACSGGAIKSGQKVVRMCFNGQNVSVSDAALINAESRLARLRAEIASAVAKHQTGRATVLHRQYADALRNYRSQLQKLLSLHLKPGFCKKT